MSVIARPLKEPARDDCAPKEIDAIEYAQYVPIFTGKWGLFFPRFDWVKVKKTIKLQPNTITEE